MPRKEEDSLTEDRARDVLRRAIEIDALENQTVSRNDIRLIAAEIDVRPESLDQAFREMGSELVAHPPASPPAVRRWLPFASVLALALMLPIFAPTAIQDFSMVGPLMLILVAAFFAASPRIRDDRGAMRITEDGIAYRTRAGRKVLKWESVLRIEPFVTGSVRVVGATQNIIVFLSDFGDPDAVLRIMKNRVRAAEETS